MNFDFPIRRNHDHLCHENVVINIRTKKKNILRYSNNDNAI